MNTALALIIIPLATAVIAIYVGGMETIIQLLDEWEERRRQRRKLRKEYNYWYDKAQSCSDFGKAAEDKGWAIACMAVIQHELSRLERR